MPDRQLFFLLFFLILPCPIPVRHNLSRDWPFSGCFPSAISTGQGQFRCHYVVENQEKTRGKLRKGCWRIVCSASNRFPRLVRLTHSIFPMTTVVSCTMDQHRELIRIKNHRSNCVRHFHIRISALQRIRKQRQCLQRMPTISLRWETGEDYFICHHFVHWIKQGR